VGGREPTFMVARSVHPYLRWGEKSLSDIANFWIIKKEVRGENTLPRGGGKEEWSFDIQNYSVENWSAERLKGATIRR